MTRKRDERSWTSRYTVARHPTALGIFLAALVGACGEGPWYPELGFEASYTRPCPEPHAGCHFEHQCGPTSVAWLGGPHADFAFLDPHDLALESLQWFEGSLEAALWRGNSSARLELDYLSRGRKVTARFDPETGLCWEEQLRTWFGALSSDGTGPVDLGKEQYYWHVEFGARGSVRGSTASDHAAVQAMKALLASLPTAGLFERPSFHLSYAVRPSSHVMNCYSEEADDAAQLDDLPERVRAKVAQYARR